MIVQLRIDERLIHGQITTAWSKALDITTIMVANDRVAADDVTVKMLLMTAPVGIKVAIKSIDDTKRLLSDPRASKMKILLIVDNPKDAVELVEALKIENVNVANFMKKKATNKVTIHGYCSADEEDFKWFEKLIKVCPNVFAQMIPSVEKQNFKELMNKARTK